MGLKLESWSDAGGLISAAAMLVAVIAALVAVWQLREMNRARRLEALSRVFELLSSDEARNDRALLYSTVDSAEGKISDEQAGAAERVCVSFDKIGSWVQLGLVPEFDLLRHHSEVIERSWLAAAKYTRSHQAAFGGERGLSFKWLAQRATTYRTKFNPHSSIHLRAERPKAVK